MAEEADGLLTRDVSDRYIDSLLERVQVKTGGDANLIDAIAHGKLGDADMLSGGRISDEMRAYLEANVDIAPGTVKGQLTHGERGVEHYWDQATQFMFSKLMGERTNNLSRSPSFRQFYYQRLEELAPFMDEAAHADAIKGMRAAGLGDVADRVAGITARGDLTLERADFVAKGFGLDSTRDLLYDMTERGQFFDAARLIFPFGEAWKELVTRWAKLGVENPAAPRRAQQIVTGARQDDSDLLFGNKPGQGFFYENEYGEEVFGYPFADLISEKLWGVPVPLTGRVAGLSLMTEVLPGVGPVGQVPAGAFMPDAPEWDWARDVLFPFGEPDTLVPLPAWLKKAGQATGILRDEKAWNGTVMDVARYLGSTGDYDTSDVDGVQKLLEDAREKAPWLHALRAGAQFFAPTAPSPEWVAKDKNGDILVAQKLIEEFHELQEEDYQTAVERMLDRYGENIGLLLQGKTAEVTPAAPVSKEGADWERANKGVVSRHSNVYGFFAPQGGDLDLTVYNRRKDAGDRQELTPEQYVRLANDRLASAIYQTQKRKVGSSPNKAQQKWLRELRADLVDDYPGFGDRSGIAEKASVETLIANLSDAVADKRLAKNPVTEPIATYLQAREKAMAAAEQAGLAPSSFAKAKQMAPVRAWLRDIAADLNDEEPAFQQVWDRVFDRELLEDENEEG
jgi:hypothetical protein